MHKLLSLVLVATLSLTALSACTSQADQIINTQTKVLQQDPNNVSALIERANAFKDKSDFTNALTDYNKAIELSPSSARAFLGRGQTYLGLNQYEKALEDLNKSIAFNPDLNEAYASRGEARVKLQSDFQAALTDFDRAIALGYNNPNLYRYRGQAYFRLNQRNQAVEAYLKASEIPTGNVELTSEASSIRIAALDEAIDFGLSDGRLYQQRGTLYRLRGSYNSAITDFTEAIRLNPQQASAFEERADAYYAGGMCTRAEDDLRAACRLENRRLCQAINLNCSPTPSATPDLNP